MLLGLVEGRLFGKSLILLKLLLLKFFSVTDLEENLLQSGDANPVRPDPKLLQLLIKLLEERLELLGAAGGQLVSDLAGNFLHLLDSINP